MTQSFQYWQRRNDQHSDITVEGREERERGRGRGGGKFSYRIKSVLVLYLAISRDR